MNKQENRYFCNLEFNLLTPARIIVVVHTHYGYQEHMVLLLYIYILK